MEKTLRDILNERRTELEAMADPIREQMKMLAEELRAIDLELRELGAAWAAIESQAEERLRRPVPEMTIKDAVMKVLSNQPYGLTAIEILHCINRDMRTDYPRTSLSPQLSRLKAEGKIILDGQMWKLSGLNQILAVINKTASQILDEKQKGSAPEGEP